jgi:hypothetical protein
MELDPETPPLEQEEPPVVVEQNQQEPPPVEEGGTVPAAVNETLNADLVRFLSCSLSLINIVYQISYLFKSANVNLESSFWRFRR